MMRAIRCFVLVAPFVFACGGSGSGNTGTGGTPATGGSLLPDGTGGSAGQPGSGTGGRVGQGGAKTSDAGTITSAGNPNGS
ncbi:MAG TPA: hypothetical protein VIM14_14215, partial [Polyangia bacterium]